MSDEITPEKIETLGGFVPVDNFLYAKCGVVFIRFDTTSHAVAIEDIEGSASDTTITTMTDMLNMLRYLGVNVTDGRIAR